MRRWRRLAAVMTWASAILLSESTDATAQTRDFTPQARSEPGGTGLISGSIVTDEQQPRPLRRVVVTIAEAASIIQPRVVTSDELGRFFFRNLPPGRYTISARRAPYLTGSYGARRIAGPGSVQAGTTIVLGSGEQIANIDVRMLRGAVITGIVRDTDGQPARNARVGAQFLQRSGTTGERTLVSYVSGTTDDRGTYRLFGLPPGSYFIFAMPPASVSAAEATVVTDADLARATALLQQAGVPAPAAASPASGPATPRRPTVAYVPIYYPATPDATQASPITVEAGEERTGADIQVQLISTARIEGTISGPGGPMKERVSLRAVRTGAGLPADTTATVAASDPQGRFVMPGLPPGTYTIEGRLSAPDQSLALYARAEVSVFGDDRTVNLTMQPAMSLAGRVVFEGATSKPMDVTKGRVSLAATAAAISVNPGFSASMMAVSPGFVTTSPGSPTPSATGDFTLTGVVPGRYRLAVTFPIPSIESGWWLKSATINGQESLDVPVEIRPGDMVTNATITMTDRPTEIFGTITDGANRAAPEYFIILFPADHTYWIVGSRRIQQTRPSSDGSFSFKNVPTGEYRLAAVTDVQQGEWFDPAFLTELVAASVPVALGESGRFRQDLRIR